MKQRQEPYRKGQLLGTGGSGKVFSGQRQDQALKVPKLWFGEDYKQTWQQQQRAQFNSTNILPQRVLKELNSQFITDDEIKTYQDNPDTMIHEFKIYNQAKDRQGLRNHLLPLKGVHPDGLVLLMQKLGPDWVELEKLIISREPTEEEMKMLMKICCRVIYGVLDLHKNGMVHNDIKPNNIFVNKKTLQVFFFDFGISCIFCKQRNKWVKCPTIKCPLQDFGGLYTQVPDEELFRLLKLEDLIRTADMLEDFLFGFFPNKFPRQTRNRKQLFKRLVNQQQVQCNPLKKFQALIERDVNWIDATRVLHQAFTSKQTFWNKIGLRRSARTQIERLLSSIFDQEVARPQLLRRLQTQTKRRPR